MKVEVLGGKDPEHAIIACIHGDEPCGLEAIERLKKEFEILRPLKLVVANEEALEEGKRFLEADMNRSFPGDLESDLLEERLAARLLEEVKGMKVLNFHSSDSVEDEPYAIVMGQSKDLIDLASKTGLKRVIDMSYVEGGLEQSLDRSVAMECRKGGVDQAYTALKNFLGSEGVIDYKAEVGQPEVYEVFDSADGSGYKFLAENFKPIEQGQVYGKNSDDVLKAEERFWPVLMSTNGYDDMLGFKSKRLERG